MFHPIRRCFSFIAHVSSSSALFRLHRSRLRQSLVDSKIPKYVSPNQFIRLSYAKQKRSGIADNSEDIPDLTGIGLTGFNRLLCVIVLHHSLAFRLSLHFEPRLRSAGVLLGSSCVFLLWVRRFSLCSCRLVHCSFDCSFWLFITSNCLYYFILVWFGYVQWA
ncbi:uncharacterized protein LOC127106699 isoform X1 [Lathyrus oleraceus]|uniref:uncharacterized protein LOC127106699 isoform X1 n=1 Tax=Pisum sativum TaxID=3888 RepID=UPI0021CF9538|nr:uncharacterized protein LOC127106699 isoform X1 [Pisum sativum]